MAARNGGKLASDLAGIPCPNAALDFDLACTIRLNKWDLERDRVRDKNLAVYIAREVNRTLFGGQDDEDEDEVSVPAGAEVW